MEKTIEQLIAQGCADYAELKAVGILRTIDLGYNDWGFRSKIVETVDGTQWDYMPEDQYYEIRENRYHVNVY